MLGTNVPLEVAGVRENLGTVLTLVVLAAVMRHLVPYQVGLPVESFGALVALVLPLLAVGQHVLLQAL